MSEDGEARHEAEIEAIARELDMVKRAEAAIADLDALRSEVERLRRDLKICQEDRAFKHRQVEALAARSPQEEAERMREALRQIADGRYHGASYIAREALRA